MHIVLDILLVAIVAAAVVIGARRGFFKSVVGLLGMVLAVVLILSFASPLASVVDDAVIRPWAVKRAVAAQGVSAETPTAELDLARVDTALSEYLKVDISGVEEIPETVGEYLDAIFLVNGITLAISKALAAVIIFVVAMLGLWILSLVLKPILKLPVLRQCNGLLGAAVGAVKAVIILLILATAIYMIGATSQTADFDTQTVEKTVLFKHLYDNNPILGWITK